MRYFQKQPHSIYRFDIQEHRYQIFRILQKRVRRAMRYIMKGGVWKNSQDEILKAAIMKYGLNQWSRISSLLQRKSAKQCKQRWYEWLDPSIKKTEWSRAEDEKLLQLARVFPSQWRTIAPFVGRTPTQCFQRYEKLLDMAQGKSAQESEDLKKLRPGQIDPNPETKPARLDPIDMDEDEKEMLAEVRVRLANTKGKKAKRKQRQKIIEEARRLAQLQKIRQLEMAGVDNIPTAKEIKRMRQKQDIDYNREIPFKRQVPQFVYKLEETQASKNNFFASTISLQTLQGKRRDVEEELQRKMDKKRLKKLKDRDYKSMLDLKNRFQKPVSTPIQLPEPQLNQKDLEDMKRYNITTPLSSVMIHNATPMNMTPENKIMLAAKVNFSLNHRDMMTPIGEQEEDAEDAMDGVQGLNYLKDMEKREKDPNRMRSVDRIMSQRVKTPSANEWEHDQDRIKSLFKGLSRPENVVEFQIPEEEEEEEDEQQMMDAEEYQKKQLELAKQAEEFKLENRNEVLKKNLPRVLNLPTTLTPSRQNVEAEKLIQQQILSMLYSDTIDYPPASFSLPEEHSYQYLQPLEREKRDQARALIEEELKSMSMLEEQKFQRSYEEVKTCMRANFSKRQFIYHPPTKQVEEQWQQKHKKTIINLLIYKQLDKANDQTEKKTRKYLAGYEKLISNKVDEINSLEKQLEQLSMQRKGLQVLAEREKNSANARLWEEENFYKMIYHSI